SGASVVSSVRTVRPSRRFMKRAMAACKRASEWPRVATRKLLSTANRSLLNVIDAGTGIRLSFGVDGCADTTMAQVTISSRVFIWFRVDALGLDRISGFTGLTRFILFIL